MKEREHRLTRERGARKLSYWVGELRTASYCPIRRVSPVSIEQPLSPKPQAFAIQLEQPHVEIKQTLIIGIMLLKWNLFI